MQGIKEGSVYILLKDKEQGEKVTRVLGVPVPRSVHTSTCRVLKGELVTPIPASDIVPHSDGQRPHNWRTVTKDSPATFYDEDSEDNTAPLKPNEFDVLAGVQSPHDRYKIFLEDDKLDWGSKLKVGDKVTVALPPAGEGSTGAVSGHTAYAVVRYVGPVKTLPGITFGVEIKDKDYFGWGTTTGVFQDELYFRCKEDCGLFVSLERLSQYPRVETLSQPPPSGRHYQPKPIPRCRENPVPPEGSSTDPQHRIVYKYRIGDRVVVFTTRNVAIHGTVRWVGMYSYTVGRKDYSAKAVGVETDVKVKKGEINSLPVKTHYFTPAKDRSAVFFNEDEVISEANFAEGVSDQHLAPDHHQLLDEAILEEGHHHPLPLQSVGGGSEETAELAKAMGVSHTELLQENKQLLHEAEQRKQQEEWEVLRKALPDESLNPAKQEQRLQQISEERREGSGGGRGGGGGKGGGGRRERGERGRGTEDGDRGSDSQQRRQDPVYDTVGESSQGVTIPACSQQQQPHHQPLPGVAEHGHHSHHQPLSGVTEHGQSQSQLPVQQPSHPQQEHGQWQQPESQAHWRAQGQQFQPHSEHEQKDLYHNIPSTNVLTTFSSTGASYGNAFAVPPAPQPLPQPQHGTHQEQHTISPRHPGHNNMPQSQLQPGQHNVAYDGHHQGSGPPSGLEVGSAVQIANNDSRTGVIRWIGTFPGVQGTIAGIELDEPMEGCGDGEWKGHHYFTCPYGRGFFCPLANVRADTRLSHGARGAGNPMKVPDWEEEDQLIRPDQFRKYTGDEKGIQGHLNSCYLDATIFGLFGLSDVFDSLFLDKRNLSLTSLQSPVPPDTPAQPVQREIGSMLWKGIVNPLRKNGAVRYESVMRLRNKLDELGKMEGVSTAEKDPEEFLNMLFKHTLHVDPFIRIKRPFGTETEFFVQLFVEPDKTLRVPTIQILLKKMFEEQQISFASVPSKLLIQVPRYGKEFQAYKRIIPDIKLDPDPLLDCPNKCFICSKSAWNTCKECRAEFIKYNTDPNFCDSCNKLVHGHKDRVNHQPECCREPEAMSELELLSVLCIETSHYVCFSREPEEGRWLFFDSMANRVYDQYNIPRGVDCTAELNEWVYEGDPERLMAARPRELPELVRRFTQDVYMCVYIQPDFGMYG